MVEYLLDGPLASRFAPALESRTGLVASTLQAYELYKVICRQGTQEQALESLDTLHRARPIPVDEPITVDAAELSVAHRLAMADAIIYSTALRAGATLVTTDSDFAGLEGVELIR